LILIEIHQIESQFLKQKSASPIKPPFFFYGNQLSLREAHGMSTRTYGSHGWGPHGCSRMV